ncbi:hypothetical protein EIP86_009291 [Pleurotus ostreatoroseus]|nr:hypothetical protein EIP86_009291 [Pleurotus ostreatoroseus]
MQPSDRRGPGARRTATSVSITPAFVIFTPTHRVGDVRYREYRYTAHRPGQRSRDRTYTYTAAEQYVQYGAPTASVPGSVKDPWEIQSSSRRQSAEGAFDVYKSSLCKLAIFDGDRFDALLGVDERSAWVKLQKRRRIDVQDRRPLHGRGAPPRSTLPRSHAYTHYSTFANCRGRERSSRERPTIQTHERRATNHRLHTDHPASGHPEGRARIQCARLSFAGSTARSSGIRPTVRDAARGPGPLGRPL